MSFRAINNNRGFSLVELVVVVSIIGLLSVVAVPSYKSFQAKARQKEGFNLLNTYYTAAQATRAEFGIYPGNFVQTGFAPVGTLGYRLRAADGNDIPIINDNACFRTYNDCDCGGNCPRFKTWQEAPVGAAGGPIGVSFPSDFPCNGVIPTGPQVTDTSFVVIVAGWISTSAALYDRYAITQNKLIQMCQDGLK